MIRLLALVLPLGLDTFAVSAALGVAGLSTRQRLRVGALFTLFEAGMPVVGLVAGAGVVQVVGRGADYFAIAALGGLGLFMLLHGDDQPDASALARVRGIRALTLGLSVSLDELAIGFTIGLLRVPVLAALALIAVQAFVLSQLGLRLGQHIGARLREGAERAAGIVLILLAGLVLATAVLGVRLG